MSYIITGVSVKWVDCNEVSRKQIVDLESAMRKMPQLQLEPQHHFADGIYARQITIPKGCLLTGKVHKTVHLNIVSKGDITVWTEEGMKRVKAPCTLVSRPGTKRVGYAHEETVWTTIHGTNETDLAKLELDLIESDQIEYKGDDVCLG